MQIKYYTRAAGCHRNAIVKNESGKRDPTRKNKYDLESEKLSELNRDPFKKKILTESRQRKNVDCLTPL